MTDIVERLRSNEILPVCPYDRRSPDYWSTPDDKPCTICGQENTSEGPDLCRGADTRIMKEAAAEIERLRAASEWRDISTAPKDGATRIDVWFQLTSDHGARWANVMWSPEHKVWIGGPPSQHEGGWVATHWRPVPAPPQRNEVKP